MFKPIMIENQQSIQCAYKHNLPIVQVVLNPQLQKQQRLLCNECLDNIDIDGKAVGYKKIVQMIEEQQQLKIDQVENIIIINIKEIKLLQIHIDQLKQNAILQLDQFKSITDDWINNLQSIGQKYSKYSFHDELENMINNQNNLKFNENLLMKDICGEQNSWNSKATHKLELFNQFSEYNKCKEILLNLQLIISRCNLNKNSENEQQTVLSEDDIKLQLTDLQVKQQDYCVSIAFNSSDSIMVSTNQSSIKVWDFNNGKLSLQQSLKQHDGWINALVFSKKQNSFLSCSSDKTIRIWKHLGQNEWISSCPYKQHTDNVFCMILNQNEEYLFSGSKDKTIKVWKLDVDKNELMYLHSLHKHNNSIYALSLNQSEQLLVSCADGEDQIIIWERGLHDKMEFKYFVKQSIKSNGSKVQFIKENQFIWVPSSKQIDEMFIYELKDGVFQENQEKKVQLNQNNDFMNKYSFPIVYNKFRNLMIVRHKFYIYLIREQNNGNFKRVEQLNMHTNTTYGTVTNNWLHLVFWDDMKKEYSIYEIQYKI